MMGMYTELVCAFEMKENVSDEVVNILKFMNQEIEKQPEGSYSHPLFSTERWKWMLRSDSYYFPGDSHTAIRYDSISKCYFVTIRTNLKNYSNEIEKFIDWITPHVRYDGKGFIGYKMYEEAEDPTPIYLGE